MSHDPGGDQKGASMKELKKIFFFIHAPSKLSAREMLKPNTTAEENWKRIVAEKGKDPSNAFCIIQGIGGDPELVRIARDSFGNRCFVDPYDDSPETRLLIVEDLELLFRNRGSHGEWNHYELWSSNNARRWIEGLKRDIDDKGYTYDPKSLKAVSYGNWTGCHHKYSNFFGRYLDLSAPVQKQSDPALSTLKQFPHRVKEFVERIDLEHHVQLFLFTREDGCPMAQYLDGLRAVWEHIHSATVDIDDLKRIQIYTISSNALIPIRSVSRTLQNGFVAEVGDGTHVHTTITGAPNAAKEFVGYDEFRDALASATISDLDLRNGVYYGVEV
jgi:hypothetical protein